ncbi:MAG: hypothetical protein F6K41_05535 [Symploca sp. SIO3E6]|nr:hypothetical protein [Caldora sp. SIO3E6]
MGSERKKVWGVWGVWGDNIRYFRKLIRKLCSNLNENSGDVYLNISSSTHIFL